MFLSFLKEILSLPRLMFTKILYIKIPCQSQCIGATVGILWRVLWYAVVSVNGRELKSELSRLLA